MRKIFTTESYNYAFPLSPSIYTLCYFIAFLALFSACQNHLRCLKNFNVQCSMHTTTIKSEPTFFKVLKNYSNDYNVQSRYLIQMN